MRRLFLPRLINPPLSRPLHLAPPFLLDSHTPLYHSLSPSQISTKRSLAHAHLSNCNLCPRLCSVNRYQTTGVCLTGALTAKVNVIAPHFAEEPCITGHNGSGSVFFSMCNLRCAFCQNHDIAHRPNGMDLTPEELGAWYVKLQDVGGVHNINLVTPEHVVPQVVLSLLHARELGLKVPVVYNTSGYDSMESLALLEGLVDVYLPDVKVWSEESGRRLLKAGDYAETVRKSVKEMYRQVGDLCFTGDGLAKRGVLVRHLVMPGLEGEGEEIVRWLAREVSRDCFVNLMEQYRPDAYVGRERRGGGRRYEEINRAVRREEVESVRRAAEEEGLWRFNEAPRHGGFTL